MFDSHVPRHLRPSRLSHATADAYFRGTDLSLATASERSGGREVWLRQHWTAPPPGTPAPCGACCCEAGGREGLVVRFRCGYPPALEGLVERGEWARFRADLDAAAAWHDPCINKCCAIATFAVLFYTTILGIFVYMCAEHACSVRRAARGRAALEAALTRWNLEWAPRGLRVTGRWHADRREEDDEPLDERGDAFDDFPLICITIGGGGGGGGYQSAYAPGGSAAGMLAAAAQGKPVPVAQIVSWGAGGAATPAQAAQPPPSAPPLGTLAAGGRSSTEEDPV
jgi:hypothetical protein